MCSMNRYNGRHTGDLLPIDDDDDGDKGNELITCILPVVDQSQWEHAT